MEQLDDFNLACRSFQLIKKDLKMETSLELQKSNPFEQLQAFLTRQIQYLLDHDFERLMNTVYRIDISENKMKAILEKSPPNEIAKNLASNIIEREKEKVLTRIKYAT